MAIPVYTGPFGRHEAERLLWRAGFGPRPGEAEALAAKGMRNAVLSLTRPTTSGLAGPAPTDDNGAPLRPVETWGHDHLWWLDRMVRTRQPLVERMTLIWHDWFATSYHGVGDRKLMLAQNRLFRRQALGSFENLLLGVTRDPAMLVWLNGHQNTRWRPNENYARELMELFTLGVDRGYSELDVRQQARALTGWTSDWTGDRSTNFRYEEDYHDGRYKTIFGQRGRYDWDDACRVVVRHPRHRSFLIRKLWGYFVPTRPDYTTRLGLERLYVRTNYAIRPVVEAILRHPAFYEGPRMVKPPVVYTAGLLRAVDRPIDTDLWAWLGTISGQLLFSPPNVAGWDDTRWLDTATFYGRWFTANWVARPMTRDLATDAGTEPFDAVQLVERAIAFWGKPAVSPETRSALVTFAQAALGDADMEWKRAWYPLLAQNALRQLIAVSPDLQTA